MSNAAAIFDLDGTLLDTIGDLADSMNAALASFGFPGHPEERHLRFVGDGVTEYARRALPEDRRDAETVAALVARMREEYFGRWKARTRPYDGVPEMLAALAAHGVPLAVLSNKPDDFTRMMVDHFFGPDRFRDVRGVRDGVPKKPDATAALEIAAAMAVPPKRVLYLGDTDTDMQTAVAAGFVPVGALWGFRDEAELREHGARHLIARPEELIDLLGEIR